MSSEKPRPTPQQFYADLEAQREAGREADRFLEIYVSTPSIAQQLADHFGVSEKLIGLRIDSEYGNEYGQDVDMTDEETSLTHIVGFAAWQLADNDGGDYDPNEEQGTLTRRGAPATY